MADQVAASNQQQPSGFQRLPLELRLRIWEATWPSARLVEVCLPSEKNSNSSGGHGRNDNSNNNNNNNNNNNRQQRIKPSRQVGGEQLTVWNSRLGHLEAIECRAYSHPLALAVCRESRTHTLRTYCSLQHAAVASCRFYFDPVRDVVWLHRDLSQFSSASLGAVQRFLFKDVERSDDSEAAKKQRRRELLEMVESAGSRVREVLVLAHWTSIGDVDVENSENANSDGETLYDWLQYFMAMLDENWELLDAHAAWVLQFVSTWAELGVCFDGGKARLWGDARGGPLYSCPSRDAVYRKRLVERFPKRFVDITRIQ